MIKWINKCDKTKSNQQNKISKVLTTFVAVNVLKEKAQGFKDMTCISSPISTLPLAWM